MVHRQQTVDSLKKFNARRKLKVCSLSVIAATFQRPPGVPPGRPSHTWPLSVIAATFQRPPGVPPGRPSHTWLRVAENDLFPIRPEPDFAGFGMTNPAPVTNPAGAGFSN